MNISEFEYSEPNGDGDVSIDMKLNVENTSSEDIDVVRCSIIFQADDAAMASSDNDEEICIESGDSEELSLCLPYFKAFNGDIKAHVMATCLHRHSVKIGEYEIPESASSFCVFLNKQLNADASVNSLTLTRMPPDDDGDITVESGILITNTSSNPLLLIGMRMKVTKGDRNIDDVSRGPEDISAKSHKQLEESMYAKKGELKGAKAEFTLFWHTILFDEVVEGTGKPE